MTRRHPRADESDARRAQLDRLKAERAAKRGGMPRGRYAFSAPGPEPRPAPTVADVVTELQRQAMGGVMVRPDVFDLARPMTWPTADGLCAQLGMSWAGLAAEAGLRVGVLTR